MSRLLLYISVAFVILLVVLGFYFSKESYKLLPINQQPTNQELTETLDWKKFTSPDNQFQVLFPVLPHHASQKIEDPLENEQKLYEVFVSERSDGTVFMINMILYPNIKSTGEISKILTKVKNDVLQAKPENKLEDEKEGIFKGFPAIDFTVSNELRIIKTKAFFVDDTLYILTEMSSKENFNPNDFKFFVDSFELLTESSVNKSQFQSQTG